MRAILKHISAKPPTWLIVQPMPKQKVIFSGLKIDLVVVAGG
jgi:hypothetical protein